MEPRDESNPSLTPQPEGAGGEGAPESLLPSEFAPASEFPLSDITPESELESESAPAPAPAPQTEALRKIQEFAAAEHTRPDLKLEAAFPFTLQIEGELSTLDRERLLDVLSKNEMGINESDLEPQFEAHRILIPRISEYAGVLIVQALRGSSAILRLSPSDRTETLGEPTFSAQTDQEEHTAEKLPIFTNSAPEDLGTVESLDTVMASVTVSPTLLEIENSPKYQATLDALKRELKYKAYHQGATALTHFKVQIDFMHIQNAYKILVTATAVRALSQA